MSGITKLQGGTLVDTFTVAGVSTANHKGGTGNDVFNVNATLTGSIDGEAGTDTLVFFPSRGLHTTSNRDWSSDVCSADLTLGFAGIDTLNGNGTGTLTGENAASTWTLN